MLSNYFEDAKETIEAALNNSNLIAVTSFHSPLPNQLVVEAYTIEHYGSDDSDRANMKLYLQYKEYDTSGDEIKSVFKALNLLILNSEADLKWTARMKERVWDNNYPSSVALDMDTGEIYLLFIYDWGIELRHFAKMPIDELTGYLLTFNQGEPYYIFIDEQAMFEALDGSEGYKHLLYNTYVCLNSVKSIKILCESR